MCRNIILENRIKKRDSKSVFESLIVNNQWEILIKMFALNILDINIKDSGGKNVLYWAILHNKIEEIKILASLKVCKYVSSNFLAINFAVFLDNIKAIEALKDCGFDIDVKDEIASTPLIYALLYNKQKSVDFLIKNGASVNHEDFMGNCAKDLIAKSYSKHRN